MDINDLFNSSSTLEKKSIITWQYGMQKCWHCKPYDSGTKQDHTSLIVGGNATPTA
ncbi:MAG: hypothetical protein Kow0089_23590 [Desulfobulbaceae bacterium]